MTTPRKLNGQKSKISKSPRNGYVSQNLNNSVVTMVRKALLSCRDDDPYNELYKIIKLEEIIKDSDVKGTKPSPSPEFRKALFYHKVLVESIIAVRRARKE